MRRFTRTLAATAIAGIGVMGIVGAANATVFDFTDARRFGAAGNAGTGVAVEGNFKFVTGAVDEFRLFIANTSPTPPGGAITGFGFFLPDGFAAGLDLGTILTGPNKASDDVVFVDFTDPNTNAITRWNLTIATMVHPTDSVANCEGPLSVACALTGTFASFKLIENDNVPQFFDIDFGAALGADITGGGNPNDGIPAGQAGGFRILFTKASGAATFGGLGIDTFDFENEDGTFWCVRWRGLTQPQGSDLQTSDAQCGNASDEITVPEPMTLALLGSGLLGLAIIRRQVVLAA